ncbi:MAG TPA: amidohydrolase family protein, partial [Steroidobacteraceae bacterium]|nr:amidohydrolase family protein [Steroidobacteraceae bacterium]
MRAITCLAVCTLSLGGVPRAAMAESVFVPATRVYTTPVAEPLRNGGVLLSDERIQAVADEHTRLEMPKGTRTSECRGVVVAGFQNSHVHFIEPAFADAAHRSAPDLQRALDAMLARYGFTTVIDTGSDVTNTIALRRRIESGELRGPRIFTVGIPLYPPDGIPFYIRDLPPDVLAKMHQPHDAHEASADVRDNLAAGADATKLFLHTSPGHDEKRLMSPEVARAAVEETHRQGKLVFAHPSSLEGMRIGIDAGVDVLVHTTLGERAPWDAAMLETMVARRMSVIPTFKLWKYELDKDHVPTSVEDMLIGNTLKELQDFRQAGGQVLFGTDVGYMHDYDPTEEYVYLSQAGMSATDILAALTMSPAARLGESDQH